MLVMTLRVGANYGEVEKRNNDMKELQELKNFNWCPWFGRRERKRETGEEREDEKKKEEIEKRQVNK